MSNIVKRLPRLKQDIRSLRGWLELEILTSFRFPVVEGILSILLFVGITVAISSVVNFVNFPIYIIPNPNWNGQPILDMIAEETILISHSIVVSVMSVFSLVTSFVVPMLVAFTIARCFEDGTLGTFLSYPISRFRLYGLKTGLSFLLTSICATISLLMVFVTIGFESIQSIFIISTTIALWVYISFATSITAFFAVLFRSVPASSAAGVITCFSITSFGLSAPSFPKIIKGILNPIQLLMDYFQGTAIQPTGVEVILAFLGVVGMSIILSIITVIVLNKIEVKG